MKIAVIGSGISGLAAAWYLKDEHEIHLFESDSRLGGHANTTFVKEAGADIPIDTGFLVYNELNYPLLTQFFKELGVETAESDMSLSIKVDEKKLEWNGTSLNTIFGQRRNLLKPGFLRMLLEILRFNREAKVNLELARANGWTLGDLIRERRYSHSLCQDYLMPCGAAIWSTPELEMLEFPAETFITFFINHKLLQVEGRPKWRTVRNGSIQYVQKVAAKLSHIYLNTPVRRVEKRGDKVIVVTDGHETEFDRVIMATHAPITAKIIKTDFQQVHQVLNAFRFESNRAVLHNDDSQMPKRKICWASWNVVGTLDSLQKRKVSLSYFINRLQPIKTMKNYFVTLNPIRSVSDPIRSFDYSHPQLNHSAIQAQRLLPNIQGHDGIYYAGAWTRYGFHEDGILSAVEIVKLIKSEGTWQSTSQAI